MSEDKKYEITETMRQNLIVLISNPIMPQLNVLADLKTLKPKEKEEKSKDKDKKGEKEKIGTEDKK